MTKDDYQPEHQFENGELVQFTPPDDWIGWLMVGNGYEDVSKVRNQIVEVTDYENHKGRFVTLNQSCCIRWDWFTKLKSE